MLFPFGKILWVKSVTLEEDELAYPGRPGRAFALHSTPDDADSLGDPAVGDIIVLTQHDRATHLVEVRGEHVEPRPKQTIKRPRDARFSMQRTCVHRLVLDLDRAPFLEQAFGFDPDATGGEVYEIATLPSFLRTNQKLWMVQRRIHHQMSQG